MYLQPSITVPIGETPKTFTFTFTTLSVMAAESDLATFDQMPPFQQLPFVLWAGLKTEKANNLEPDFSPADMEKLMFAMNPDDVADVFNHGIQALGFIGQTMTRLGQTIQPTKPAKAKAGK